MISSHDVCALLVMHNQWGLGAVHLSTYTICKIYSVSWSIIVVRRCFMKLRIFYKQYMIQFCFDDSDSDDENDDDDGDDDDNDNDDDDGLMMINLWKHEPMNELWNIISNTWVWFTWQSRWNNAVPHTFTVKPLDISRTKSQSVMFFVSSCSRLCPNYWSQVCSRDWRSSWSSAQQATLQLNLSDKQF